MLLKRFAKAMQRLFPKNSRPPVLVACSGGVDSMVLLDLVRSFYERVGELSNVHVCHLNHGQRSESEAQADEAIVRDYCAHHNLELATHALDARKGASEATLRTLRCRRLAAEAQAARRVVLTGHHLEDNTETLLLRIIRGAHPDTLRGISPRAKRQLSGKLSLHLARPLLGFTKAELIAHARRHGILWHEDSTNQTPVYARNRIRHELLPLLETLRPGAAQRVGCFLKDVAQKQGKRHALKPTVITRLAKDLSSKDGCPIQSAHFAELKAALDLLLRDQASRTTRAHWETLKRQLKARQATRQGGGPLKMLQFPGGSVLCLRGNRAFWVRNS